MSVEKPSPKAQHSLCILEVTQNPTNVTNVGRPSARAHPLPSTYAGTRARSPSTAASVGKPSLRSHLLLFI
ncbi:hypothetical protein LEMLEM_LOCUS19113 [Lemmus lemmus]